MKRDMLLVITLYWTLVYVMKPFYGLVLYWNFSHSKAFWYQFFIHFHKINAEISFLWYVVRLVRNQTLTVFRIQKVEIKHKLLLFIQFLFRLFVFGKLVSYQMDYTSENIGGNQCLLWMNRIFFPLNKLDFYLNIMINVSFKGFFYL
jgi:hypothetical protein